MPTSTLRTFKAWPQFESKFKALIPKEIIIQKSIQIDASSSEVWNQLTNKKGIEIQQSPFSLSSMIGFPKHLRTTLDTLQIGGKRKAIYEKGNFRYSDLVGVNFRKAYLRNVSLSYASLAQAFFPEANLGQADLTKSQLTQADFSQANLSQADLSESDLTKALLRDARLTGANLQEADLRQANLQNADLSFANLTNAKLSGANLLGAKLDQAIVHASWMGVLAKTSGDSIIGKTYVLENYRLDSVSTDAGVGYRLRLRRAPSAEI